MHYENAMFEEKKVLIIPSPFVEQTPTLQICYVPLSSVVEPCRYQNLKDQMISRRFSSRKTDFNRGFSSVFFSIIPDLPKVLQFSK